MTVTVTHVAGVVAGLTVGALLAAGGAWLSGFGPGATAVAVEIDLAEPGRVGVFTLLGWLLGVAAGWPGMRWVAGRGAPEAAKVLAGLGFVLLIPGTVITTGELIHAAFVLPDTLTPPALWGGYLFSGVRAFTTFGVLLLIAAGAVRAAGASGRSGGVPKAWPFGGARS